MTIDTEPQPYRNLGRNLSVAIALARLYRGRSPRHPAGAADGPATRGGTVALALGVIAAGVALLLIEAAAVVAYVRIADALARRSAQQVEGN